MNKPEIKNELQQMSGGMKKVGRRKEKRHEETVGDGTHHEIV